MGTVHEETERKYDGVPGRPLVAAGLPDVIDVAAGKAENLDAVYYDTADLRLLRSGLTLRRRTGGHDPGWHLKIPRGDGHRSEYGLPLEAGEEESPPREFVVRTRGIARGMGLHPVARLHTRRERVVLMDPDGRQLAELARDEVCGQVIDAARTGRRRPGGAPGPSGSVTDVTEVIAWTETEVELIKGPRELLDAVDEALRDQGLQPAVTSSKLERVLSDRLPPRPRQTEAAAGSVGEALTAYLRAQTAQIRELDPAVRLDEPDAVHRMRVAVRRLRSALTAHRRLLAASTVDHLSEELRWLGHVLGEARDAEVLGLHLSDQAATLPPAAHPGQVVSRVRAWFGDRYAEAHRAAVRSMDSRRYYAVLDALGELAAAPPLRGRAGHGRAEVRRALRREKRRTGRRLDRALDMAPGPGRDRALHRARKAAKRARYTAESVAPPTGSGARRYGKRMKKIQQALGAHQDGVVAEQAVLALAAAATGDGGGTDVAFGYGVLYAMQRQGAQEQLDTARRQWDRLDH